MTIMNRLANSRNEYQGKDKRVLFVSSAGLLRSPTAARVFNKPPYNWNTRAAGLSEDYALIIVDEVLMRWADTIFVMSWEQYEQIKEKFPNYGDKVYCLNIADEFEYMHEDLQKILKEKMHKFIESPE